MFTRKPKASHLDTVLYEIEMLEFCNQKLVHAPCSAGGEKSAYLECFLVHYRNLIRFLSGEKHRTGDLSLSEPATWANGKIAPQEIDSLKCAGQGLDQKYWQEISQYIEHLTTHRHETDTEWDIDEMYRELKPILSQFQRLIGRGEALEAPPNPVLGMMAGVPELMDEAVELAMKAREGHPLRKLDG